MKIRYSSHGYEATVTVPIFEGVPTDPPPDDDSGEAAVGWDAVGKQLVIWDSETETWDTAGGGGGGGGGGVDITALHKTQNLSDLTNVATARTNLGLGSAATRAVTAFLQTANDLSDVVASTARTNLGLGTMATQDASAVAITGGTITGMSDPSTSSDVATKGYVDVLVNGLKWKAAVRAAATSNTTVASIVAGSTLDGVTLVSGNRFLLKGQTDPKENGIYTALTGTAPVRTADADTGSELISAAVFVSEGTVNHDTAWVCTNDTVTIGVTSIVFVTFASTLGTLLAGNNLSDLTSASTARTNLGLGTMATQAASAVAITGGTITGLPTPTSSADAATKQYVDDNAGGVSDPLTLLPAPPGWDYAYSPLSLNLYQRGEWAFTFSDSAASTETYGTTYGCAFGMHTNPNANAYVGLITSTIFRLGVGTWNCWSNVAIDHLPTVDEEIVSGFWTWFVGGAYFKLDPATHHWLCIVETSGGGSVSYNTGITPPLTSGGGDANFTLLRVEVINTTTVNFYINNVLVKTFNSSPPLPSSPCGHIVWQIGNKSVATAIHGYFTHWRVRWDL